MTEGSLRKPTVDKDYVWLKPGDVLIDPEVQRRLDSTHANRLAKAYDPALFGLGHVSARDDGEYYVIDGQHRVEGAKIAGQAHIAVLFKVYRGLTISQEADLFLKLNDKKKAVNAIDQFDKAVKAGHPIECDIVKILGSFGLKVATHQGQTSGTVMAVVALIHLYHGKVAIKPLDAEDSAVFREHLLSRTLHVLTKAWGKDKSAFDAVLLKGVAATLYKHGSRIDGDRLAKCLQKNATADETIGRIRSLQSAARKSILLSAVDILESMYNRGKHETKRL